MKIVNKEKGYIVQNIKTGKYMRVVLKYGENISFTKNPIDATIFLGKDGTKDYEPSTEKAINKIEYYLREYAKKVKSYNGEDIEIKCVEITYDMKKPLDF